MRERLLKGRILVGFILFLFFIGIPTITGLSSELNFHVSPLLPLSQVEGTSPYFDLNLTPGETETLGLALVNTSRDAIEVKITAHTAYTNVNGVVEYGKEAAEPDPTLVYHLGDLIETPDVITLAPGEARELFLTLTMPDESFEGLLTGGLRIEEVTKEEQAPQQEGVAIKNNFSYVIGVVVSNDRSTVTPDLDLLDVFADQLNYRNVFSATIQNFTPTFVNQLEVNAEIRERGNNEILYEVHRTGMQMAPNSHFHFPISLNGERFRSVDYVLTLRARSGEHEWSWDQPFTVDAQTSRQLNREDVTVTSGFNFWMILSISLGSLLLFIVGYFIYKQQQMKIELQIREETKDEETKE